MGNKRGTYNLVEEALPGINYNPEGIRSKKSKSQHASGFGLEAVEGLPGKRPGAPRGSKYGQTLDSFLESGAQAARMKIGNKKPQIVVATLRTYVHRYPEYAGKVKIAQRGTDIYLVRQEEGGE